MAAIMQCYMTEASIAASSAVPMRLAAQTDSFCIATTVGVSEHELFNGRFHALMQAAATACRQVHDV
jgi:hypothetical protein